MTDIKRTRPQHVFALDADKHTLHAYASPEAREAAMDKNSYLTVVARTFARRRSANEDLGLFPGGDLYIKDDFTYAWPLSVKLIRPAMLDDENLATLASIIQDEFHDDVARYFCNNGIYPTRENMTAKQMRLFKKIQKNLTKELATTAKKLVSELANKYENELVKVLTGDAPAGADE